MYMCFVGHFQLISLVFLATVSSVVNVSGIAFAKLCRPVKLCRMVTPVHSFFFGGALARIMLLVVRLGE